MIVYNKYLNSRDNTWYDSSNVVYSECIDTSDKFKTLKIVFKQGRTYLYKNVEVEDYIMFRNAESNGSAFSKYIKKYDFVRLPDTDLEELEKKKQSLQEENKPIEETFSNLVYKLNFNPDSKELQLLFNDTIIYEGVEDNINIMKLFKSMSINYNLDINKDFKLENEKNA